MNFSALSIKHPIPAIMLFVLLTLAGILSYRASVVQDFPDIELPIVTVSATLSGAAPAQLETEIDRRTGGDDLHRRGCPGVQRPRNTPG